MGKKSKGKNNTKPIQTQQTTSITELSNAEIEKIEKFDAEVMPEDVKSLVVDSLPDTSEDSSQQATVRRTGNVDPILNLLHEKLRKIKAIEAKAEEIKNKNIAAQKELEEKEKALKSSKVDFEKEMETRKGSLNEREAKIQEQQLAIDNGQFSSVISDLLASMRKAEEDIAGSTKQLVLDMGTNHKNYVEALRALEIQKDGLEQEKIEIERLRNELARERRKLDALRSSIEEEIRWKIEDEFQDKQDSLVLENSSLKRKSIVLEKQVQELSSFRQQILDTFESSDVTQMVKEQSALRSMCEDLQNQLSQLPSVGEYKRKIDTIEELQTKVHELEEKVSEENLAQLRLSLHNADAYILEVNTYKAKLDSAEAREKSLQRTIKDLHDTINQLKDEEKAKEGAFEQSRVMDASAELQQRELRFSAPDTLYELVVYLQRHMAQMSDPKPFYYTQKSIRTFLAGLHMSPLSILQGISGTGKTSLPREVAKTLVAGDLNYVGLDEDSNSRKEPYRICAIQSGWRDNMDLMGFYNNFEKKYKETDFYQALYLASQPKYRNTLFLVILDEMNLSHPEHYFADFLSLMEQDPNDRFIQIVAPNDVLPALLKNHGGKLHLPNNVRFIGTANHDETTLDFAPKTYDRSNVMVMRTNDKSIVLSEIKKSPSISQKYAVNYTWLLKQFKEAESKFIRRYEQFDNFVKNPELIKSLSELGLGVGNRFDEQARKFICAYMEAGQDTNACLAEAVDHLITSRLFRTLRNRYDLSADTLSQFKDKYTLLFMQAFGNEKPADGAQLLDEEIAKK